MKTVQSTNFALVLIAFVLFGATGASKRESVDLLADLKDKDPAVRAQAAKTLALPKSAATADALPPLLEAMKDKDDRVRANAAEAVLYRLGGPNPPTPELKAAAIATVLRALNDNCKEVRFHAVKSLGSALEKDKKILTAVRKTLREDKEPSVRAAAEIALGNIGPTAREALPDLLRAAKDSNAEVRMRAIYALQLIVGYDHKRLAVVIRDKAVIQAMLAALKDDDAEVRSAAMNVTHSLKAEEAVPPLVEMLKSEDDIMRRAAVYTLGRRGPDAKDAIPAIKLLLKDPDKLIREAAANALRTIQGKRPSR